MECSKILFCAIPGCGLRGDNNESKKIKFYKFPSPKDECSKKQRRSWLKASGSRKVTKFMRICSRHFESGELYFICIKFRSLEGCGLRREQ